MNANTIQFKIDQIETALQEGAKSLGTGISKTTINTNTLSTLLFCAKFVLVQFEEHPGQVPTIEFEDG